jgi:hypothetical protein
MTLPSDDAELARYIDFAISRWRLDHYFEQIQVQGLFLGIRLSRADYLKIVRDYCDERDDPETDRPGFDFRELL